VHYFADFRKFCAHQESSQEFIERLDASALQRFSIGLLETVLRQFDDLEEVTASSVRRAIIMLTAFYNAAARSQRYVSFQPQFG
jgi:CRISPR/Cas system-associated protein endoribonuclease Cas2